MDMRYLAGLMAGVAMALPAAGRAQNATSAPAPSSIDSDQAKEIVVTATKRSETLQNVPLSVAVASAEQIEKAHIVDLKDLQTIIPSLKVEQQQSTGQTNFIIRGFGNGANNDGIESSVGVFIDGVYRSRSAAALDDLPEIERVEVLRGPQSTLFGKNVSSGAINIITARPSFTWGGSAEVSVGNYGLINPKATVTGPISDKIAFRLSGSVDERDGYLHNVVTGGDVNNLNRWSVRGDLLIEPTSDLSIRIIADYNKINELCCGITAASNGPVTAAIAALGYAVNDPTKRYDDIIVPNQDSTNRIIGKGISGQIDWSLGGAKLTSITAYRDQTNHAVGDVDYTSADIATLINGDNVKTFTQEVRLASDNKGPLSWLIGGFYDHERLTTGRDIYYGSDARRFVDALSGGYINQLETVQSLTDPSIIPGKTYFAPGLAIADDYRMKQDSFSIFGQTDYKIGRLTLTAGGSYMHDRKAVVSDVVLGDKFSALNLQDIPQLALLGLPVNAFSGLSALQFFYGDTANHAPVNYPNANESGILTGSKFTYALRAAYDVGPVNVYVSYSTGWKAGAYNLSSDSRPPDANGIGRTAGPENVKNYEAGLKARFHGGFFNVAVFKEVIKGFQANAFDGISYSLVNAGQESSKGVEIDSSWSPMRWLNLTGAMTYLDPRYDSFTKAPCVAFDTVRCPVDPTTGQMPTFRDISGERPAGIPTWTITTTATISHDFGDGWKTFLHGEYEYISKTSLGEDVPEGLTVYGGNVFNASFSIANSRSQMSVLLWARNLTNDRFPTAIFPATLQSGSYSEFPNQPRTYGVTFKKSF